MILRPRSVAALLAAAFLLPAGGAFAQPAAGYDQSQSQGYAQPQSQGYAQPQSQGYGQPQSQGYVQSGPHPGDPGYVRPKPKGGCLKYGAVGAVGGHLAHHGVLGAIGGCATGMYVKHRSKKSIRETGQP